MEKNLPPSIVIECIHQSHSPSLVRISGTPRQAILRTIVIDKEILGVLLMIVLRHSCPPIIALPEKESTDGIDDTIEELSIGMIDREHERLDRLLGIVIDVRTGLAEFDHGICTVKDIIAFTRSPPVSLLHQRRAVNER